jgi:hypothetical protein
LTKKAQFFILLGSSEALFPKEKQPVGQQKERSYGLGAAVSASPPRENMPVPSSKRVFLFGKAREV